MRKLINSLVSTVKLIRNSNAFSLQPMERFVLAALLCILALSAGCVISPRRIVGQGGGGSPTPTPVPGSAAGKIYVSIPSSGNILRFDNASTATGTAVPAAVIGGTQTTLNSPQGIFIDEAADRLYVANQGGASILVFDAISTKTGSIVPTRTIFGAATSLLSPSLVAVDTVKNILYVADGVDLLAFNSASTANGNAPFARDIKFGFTIAGMYLDSAADRLFLVDSSTNAIDIFDNVSALNVTTAPTRQLIGAATLLNQPVAVGVDSPGKLIVANAGSNSINVYVNAMAINGNTAPTFQITGSNTTLNSPAQIAVNKSSTKVEVFIANTGGSNIPVFSDLGSSTASGNATPSRNISGASTLVLPVGIALDTTR